MDSRTAYAAHASHAAPAYSGGCLRDHFARATDAIAWESDQPGISDSRRRDRRADSDCFSGHRWAIRKELQHGCRRPQENDGTHVDDRQVAERQAAERDSNTYTDAIG